MKKANLTFILSLLLAVPSIFFASCKKDTIPYEPVLDHWVLTNYTSGGNPMTLTFLGEELEVRHATRKMPPFYESNRWQYQVENDSILIIWYDESDNYDDYEYYYHYEYELGFSMSTDRNYLTITYKGNLLHPSEHVYTFFRR